MLKRLVFVTATRADFGKLKSLIQISGKEFDIYVFVTGMHLLDIFGYTIEEVRKAGLKNIYPFINQKIGDSQDKALASTIYGLSEFVNEKNPDLIVVHGDRVEALAGAVVGAFNNIFVAHIEGGEVSGTIDESLRHAITKLSHYHFVSNEVAKRRLLQLGEAEKTIFPIGSADIELMSSKSLPKLSEVIKYYGINFDSYAIVLLHPVTTELERLAKDVSEFVKALEESGDNFIVVYPNNDPGFSTILEEYEKFKNQKRFRVIPSIRFEYFLSLLKHSRFVIGNSSAGIREAPVFAVPTINIGTRQSSRSRHRDILHTEFNKESILRAIKIAKSLRLTPHNEFGLRDTSARFLKIIKSKAFWSGDIQKSFIGREIRDSGERD